MNDVPSLQEMYDRACVGLASQGFNRCMGEARNTCDYVSPDGARHCAWGWVDPDQKNILGVSTGVRALAERRQGLASRLSSDELDFAVQLQNAHDSGFTPDTMRAELLGLASTFGLEPHPSLL